MSGLERTWGSGGSREVANMDIGGSVGGFGDAVGKAVEKIGLAHQQRLLQHQQNEHQLVRDALHNLQVHHLLREAPEGTTEIHHEIGKSTKIKIGGGGITRPKPTNKKAPINKAAITRHLNLHGKNPNTREAGESYQRLVQKHGKGAVDRAIKNHPLSKPKV